MYARRGFIAAAGLSLIALGLPSRARQTDGDDAAGQLVAAWRALEQRSGGRLGVFLRDSGSGVSLGHRAHERFPMCSTFKFLLAAAVLQRVDRGLLQLEQRLPIRRQDMLSHAPVTSRHVGGDLDVAALCEATMIWSDNPAANLLLPLVGDPAGLTAFLRASGDAVTRNDRNEPDVNLFAPDDPRDTTTPAAMAGNLQRLVLGQVLSPESRGRLAGWLVDNRTGDAQIRAGLPAHWTVGDKTGSNGRDTGNDIAVIWPDGGRAPWLLACYLQGAALDKAGRDGVLRDAAALAAGWIGRH